MRSLVAAGAALLVASGTPHLRLAAATAHAHGHAHVELEFGAAYATPETEYFFWLETPTANPFLTVFAAASDHAAEDAIDTAESTEKQSAEHLLEEAADGDGCVKNVTSLLHVADTSAAAAAFTISPSTSCAYELLAAGATGGATGGSFATTTSGLPMKLFKLQVAASVSHIVVFSTSTQLAHLSLLDEEGHKISPAHVMAHGAAAAVAGHDDHDHKPWGEMLAATLTVNAIAFVGVFVVAASVLMAGKANAGGSPAAGATSSEDDSFAAQHARATASGPWIAASSAFAAGALLAAAVYFMWFEASHLIMDGMKGHEESEVTFVWGTAILCGFVITPVVSLAFQAILGSMNGGAAGDAVANGGGSNSVEMHDLDEEKAVVADGIVAQKAGGVSKDGMTMGVGVGEESAAAKAAVEASSGDDTSFAAQHARAAARGPWIAASSAFAAGALLAAAVYFMWFEATHLFADGIADAEESYLTFLWGTAILVGFLVTPVVNLAFETLLAAVGGGRGDDSTITAGQKIGNQSSANAGVMAEGVVMEKLGMPELQASKEQEEAAALKEQKQIQTLLISVLLGDFLHNFADGVFIGAAFLTCSHSKGWIVALGAVLHEIAQEIADYLLLTGPAKLSPWKALALNFASGLSVVFGGLLALASDYDKASIGFVMAFGGGTYVYIAAVECIVLGNVAWRA